MTERPTCATCRWWEHIPNTDTPIGYCDYHLQGHVTASTDACPEHQPRETESDIPSQR